MRLKLDEAMEHVIAVGGGVEVSQIGRKVTIVLTYPTQEALDNAPSMVAGDRIRPPGVQAEVKDDLLRSDWTATLNPGNLEFKPESKPLKNPLTSPRSANTGLMERFVIEAQAKGIEITWERFARMFDEVNK